MGADLRAVLRVCFHLGLSRQRDHSAADDPGCDQDLRGPQLRPHQHPHCHRPHEQRRGCRHRDRRPSQCVDREPQRHAQNWLVKS